MQRLATGNPPYYLPPLIKEYKSLDRNSAQAKKLRLKIAVNIGDKEVLRKILGVTPEKLSGKKQTKSNMDTIDSFLNKFGSNLAPSGYIPEEPDLKSPKPKIKSTAANDSELKKLIKSHAYEEALKLIEAQNLINPQKSIYFAHQIRFLKKLIAIENYKTNG